MAKAKKKAAKKKAAKKKPAKKKAAKKKPAALRAAEERVTGLKWAVMAAELVQRSRASMRTAPKACKSALERASVALQKAIRACD